MAVIERLRIRSIQVKIVFWAGLCLLLGLTPMMGYATKALYDIAAESTEDHIVAEVLLETEEIKDGIESALSEARVLAHTLAATKREKLELTRGEASVLLRGVLDYGPRVIGAYTIWEPDAFDGRDADFAGQEPYDQTGRFVAYWLRDEQGRVRQGVPADIKVEGLEEYYELLKKTRLEYVVGPYMRDVHGKELPIASLVVPIIVNGHLYGIIGADIDLSFVQGWADEANIQNGVGKAIVVNNGGILVGVTDQPELVGQGMEVIHGPDAEDRLGTIQRGEKGVKLTQHTMEVFVPMAFGYAKAPWSVNVSIPRVEVNRVASALVWRLTGIAGLVVLGILVLLWFVAGKVAKPIQTITKVARSVSQGDLTVKADVRSGDETGVLADTFNQMLFQLRDMLRSEQEQRAYLEVMVEAYVDYVANVAKGDLTARLAIGEDVDDSGDPLTVLGNELNATTASLQNMTLKIREAAMGLSSASSEILAATTQQASGASEQSAAIAETTTTVDELKTIAQQSMGRAQEVAGTSQRTVEVSRAGREAVVAAIGSMGEIRARVEGIAENILTLSEQTQQIGEIIATVNEIASQSNILALNASVEAARAGEYGKGFAVVAAEVRSLAEQSRQATAQVRAILSDIQGATNATVMATEEGTKGVEEGMRLAGKAGEAIEELAGVIEESAQAAAQMVAGGRQQAAGVEQVAVAMQSINQATVQSLASTRQAEKAARELNDLARSLSDTVEQYRL